MSQSLKIFASAFLLLGIIAFFIGDNPPQSADDLALTFSEFDGVIAAEVNKISAVELAEKLIQQKDFYHLVDLQGEQASYQIPTAESYSVQSFLDKKIPVNQSIYLYSKSETESLQLYYLLIIRGYFKVKVLDGGVGQWFKDVLQPDVSLIDKNAILHRRKITEYFGGGFGSTNEKIEIKKVLLEKKEKKHQGC